MYRCQYTHSSTRCKHLLCIQDVQPTVSPVSPQGPGSPHGTAAGAAAAGEVAVEEMAERLTQTEKLVAQLKEMIREKDATLRSKDDQLKVKPNLQLMFGNILI